MSNFKHLQAMSKNEIGRVAPSVLAPTAMPGVSERYQFVSTGDLLDTLGQAGYLPVAAGQAKARSDDGRTYSKHVVRMVHELNMDGRHLKVGDVIPQIVLHNSHNRTSAFQLSIGLFRLWCANGCAASIGDFESVRVLHTDPKIHDHIIDGTKLITELTESTVLPYVKKMTGFELTMAQAREFAEAASALKNKGEVRESEIDGLLDCRREEDAKMTFWNVYNRIQENAVRGGFRFLNRQGQNIQSKGIQSVERDLDFNMNLWRLGARALESWA